MQLSNLISTTYMYLDNKIGQCYNKQTYNIQLDVKRYSIEVILLRYKFETNERKLITFKNRIIKTYTPFTNEYDFFP